MLFPIHLRAVKRRHLAEAAHAVLRGDFGYLRRRYDRLVHRTADATALRSVKSAVGLLAGCDVKSEATAPLGHDLAVLADCLDADRAILVVDHDIGGGANAYRRELVRDRLSTHHSVFLVTYDTLAGRHVLTVHLADRSARFCFSSPAILEELFQNCRLAEIIYNNLVTYPDVPEFLKLLERLVDGPTPLTVLIHDYLPVCPSYNLINKDGVFCGIPDECECRSCLAANVFVDHVRGIDISVWRATWRRVLAISTTIVCFSDSSRRWLEKTYPESGQKLRVRPHSLINRFDRLPKLALEQPLHIGVVGTINHAKGLDIVCEMTRILRREDPTVRLTIIGEASRPVSGANLVVTGKYHRDDLPQLLEQHQINVCWLPSIWPETFSYVAEELMSLQVPLCCFDLGAPAERVRSYRLGRVVEQVDARSAYVAAALLLKDARNAKSRRSDSVR